MRTSTLVASLVVVMALPAQARAFGPGVHSREAQEVLRRLAADDPTMAALEAAPMARSWLTIGAISPDFMFMTAALPFGHEPGLAAHLRAEAAAKGPEYQLFALGNTCHVASDGASEAFVVPALFSSAAIGATDLFADQKAYKEAEGIVESLGDLETGDWDAVVDALFDLWLGTAEDRARFDAVFAWYCAEGSAYLARPTDCEAARAGIGATLTKVEEVLGGFDREGAHAFIRDLVALPIDGAIDFLMGAAGGSLGGLVGGDLGSGPSPTAAAEIAFLKTTALVDRAFWAGYDDLAGLGPSFALDRIATGRTGWPVYDAEGIESGLLASYLQFLPDAYAVTPGFMVDAVTWRDGDGATLAAATPDLDGATLTVEVRVYSARPLAGTLHGRVRKDLPGLDAAADPIVGESAIDLAIDPTTYVTTPRDVLAVPFTSDLDGALGFVVELALGDARPTLTTSRDRLFTSDAIDLASASFAEILGTSPRSLPVAEPDVASAVVVARAVVAPSGPGIAQAEVSLDDVDTATSNARGFAVFGDVAPGPHAITVSAAGYAAAEPVDLDALDLAAGDGPTHVRVALHAIPLITAGHDGWATGPSLAVAVDPTPFAGQARGFIVKVLDDLGRALGEAALPETGAGSVALAPTPADGARLEVTARATYAEGEGVLGRASVGVDASAPELGLSVTAEPAPECAPAAGPWQPTATVTIVAHEPHSGLAALAWRAGGDWVDLPLEADAAAATATVTPPAGALTIEVRAANAAGLDATTAAALPGPITLPACPTAAEPEPDASPEADASTPSAEPARATDDGCATGPFDLAAGLVAAAGALAIRSARPASRTRRARLTAG